MSTIEKMTDGRQKYRKLALKADAAGVNQPTGKPMHYNHFNKKIITEKGKEIPQVLRTLTSKFWLEYKYIQNTLLVIQIPVLQEHPC